MSNHSRQIANYNVLTNGSHPVRINIDPNSNASNGFIVGQPYLIKTRYIQRADDSDEKDEDMSNDRIAIYKGAPNYYELKFNVINERKRKLILNPDDKEFLQWKNPKHKTIILDCENGCEDHTFFHMKPENMNYEYVTNRLHIRKPKSRTYSSIKPTRQGGKRTKRRTIKNKNI